MLGSMRDRNQRDNETNLDTLKEQLLNRIDRDHPKYQGIEKALTFQGLLKVACQKRKTSYFSSEIGKTKTMILLKNILDQDKTIYRNFRHCCSDKNGNIRFGAMRYFAFYGFLKNNEQAEGVELPSYARMPDYDSKSSRQRDMFAYHYAIKNTKSSAKYIMFEMDGENLRNDDDLDFYS